ncbi:hypothetical protein Tco_0921306 [Tanacetum coccineum]
MAKGQPKKKKAKKDVFTVNFHFDGIFTSWPLKYCQGQVRVMTDTNFDEMSYEVLKEIAKKLVPHALFEKIYYCQTGVKLTLGLREIKSTQDIAEMMKVGYESGNEIDMYVEHFGYDIMELVKLEVNQEDNHNNIEESDDEYYGSDDYEEIENVDFETEGDEKNTEAPLADPDDHQIHAVNKVQSGVLYPAFDPDIPWDKMEPTLGMRYETPYQLKLALTNYGVAHGYQLWVMKNKVRSGVKIGVKKKVVKKKVVKKKVVNKKPVSDSGEGTSQSPKWTKKQIRDSKQVVCPFRMYASWMSNEHSFQIKSLNSEHKCCRNYNLGSLVTFRWIALHFFKEIIEDPFMSLRKMRADIRQKFMIDVSLGQCRRAKQLALFDHEGGLIEHYGKLYQYRQALLDSNPGSTCRLDVDESSNGSATFKRIYICFKGVKDGWLLGCRKTIGVGSNMWKRTNDVPPLPPLVRRMPGRPQKSRIKAPGETSGSHTSRVGRTMTCTNCWQKGHNKATCNADPTPKPPVEKKPPGRNKQSAVGYCASRGRGRGKDGSENEASGSRMGGIDEASGGGRGGTGGRGRRGRGMKSSVGGEEVVVEVIELLVVQELDEEAYRECMEEQVREQAKNNAKQEKLDKERREEREWEEKIRFLLSIPDPIPSATLVVSLVSIPGNSSTFSVVTPVVLFTQTPDYWDHKQKSKGGNCHEFFRNTRSVGGFQSLLLL